jgi:hypothetical protein
VKVDLLKEIRGIHIIRYVRYQLLETMEITDVNQAFRFL